jgi:hypothetical protein
MQHRTTVSFVCAVLLGGAPLATSAGPQDVAEATKLIGEAAKISSQLAAMNIALEAPKPIAGSGGAFISPYRCDGSATEWSDKAMSAAAGSAVGGMAGDKAAGALASKIPFAGGFLGGKMKDKAAKEGAAIAAGGWEFIKSSSDMSFDSVEAMSLWMHVRHGADEGYKERLAAAMGLYPELKKDYVKALQNAAKAAKKNPPAAAPEAAPVADAAAVPTAEGTDAATMAPPPVGDCG